MIDNTSDRSLYDQVTDAVLDAIVDITLRQRGTIRLTDEILADLRMDDEDFGFLFVPDLERVLNVKTSQDDWSNIYTVQDTIEMLVKKKQK